MSDARSIDSQSGPVSPPSHALKHVCIHGHFYQPPRENPWLEELEHESSAAPAHDWNERIAAECYGPNAASVVLDDDGKIVDLVNNYRSMSFNFGATLLRWMQKHAPAAYAAVLSADRDSAAQNHGHGNAIAQVYNHAILPLCNARDKRTQIRWGARDFELRFGRKAEGMWLAETACDVDTLAVLADEGIAFTILSPYQAKGWRFLDGSPWRSCEDGSIPTGRAYLHQRASGRPLHLFFYDGAIARGVAFERVLSDASHLIGSIDAAYHRRQTRERESWLVHTATDGESYGHHFQRGDMALAAALSRLKRDPLVRLTNYGSFLAQNTVCAEAQVLDVSAWSCAHGVGRWQRDCGCNMHGGPGWNQRWREHLRAALDVLRDFLAPHFEEQMARFCRDPWEARDRYIDVVFDRTLARQFAASQMRSSASTDDVVRFFRLLEMQRALLLMYTSCGWFFDDISGQESVILLKYAARALELASAAGLPSCTETFLAVLQRAESNVRAADGTKRSGRDIFCSLAQPAAASADSVVVSYALRALTQRNKRSDTLYAWRVTAHDEQRLTKGAVPCVVGRVALQDERTLDTRDHLYALAHFGGLDFRCSVKPFTPGTDLSAVMSRVRASAVEGNTQAVMRTLDDVFGPQVLTLKDAFLDLRQHAARSIAVDKMGLLLAVGRELVDNHRSLLGSLRDLGVDLAAHVATLVAFVASDRLATLAAELVAATDEDDEDSAKRGDRELQWRALSSQLAFVLDDAQALGMTVDVRAGADVVVRALIDALTQLALTPSTSARARVRRRLDACLLLKASGSNADLVTAVFQTIDGAREAGLVRDVLLADPGIVRDLDTLCGSAFAKRLV